MNFLNKLKKVAGLHVEKKNIDNTESICEILKDDTIDVVFAKTLIQNNGMFFYCDNKEELIQTIQAINQKLNPNSIYCTEAILQKLLSKRTFC